MMGHDYPPFDKTALDRIMGEDGSGGPHCPWGCEPLDIFDLPFDDSPRPDLYRTCLECPTCKRGFTVYVWYTGDGLDQHGHCEVHAGWPPDAIR